jgi:hypothetical protein
MEDLGSDRRKILCYKTNYKKSGHNEEYRIHLKHY